MNSSNTIHHEIVKAPDPPEALARTKPHDLFPSSPELGACVSRLHDEQKKIDREEVERLARLREVADRD